MEKKMSSSELLQIQATTITMMKNAHQKEMQQHNVKFIDPA
jgi:hypothetical protein